MDDSTVQQHDETRKITKQGSNSSEILLSNKKKISTIAQQTKDVVVAVDFAVKQLNQTIVQVNLFKLCE